MIDIQRKLASNLLSVEESVPGRANLQLSRLVLITFKSRNVTNTTCILCILSWFLFQFIVNSLIHKMNECIIDGRILFGRFGSLDVFFCFNVGKLCNYEIL